MSIQSIEVGSKLVIQPDQGKIANFQQKGAKNLNIKLKGWGNQQFGANGSLEQIVGWNKKKVGENSRTEKYEV